MGENATTLRDLALRSGFHLVTVCRALKGDARVSLQTREKIVGLARASRYRPSPVNMALTLRRKDLRARDRALSIVFLSNRKHLSEIWDVPHIKDLVEGVRSRAENQGYRFRVVLCGKGAASVAEVKRAVGPQDRTAVIAGVFLAHKGPYPFRDEEYAVVRVNSSHLLQSSPVIEMNQYEAVRCALMRARELGYTKIGLAVGKMDLQSSGRSYSCGYLGSCEQAGISALPLFELQDSHSWRARAEGVACWITSHHIDLVLTNWRGGRRLGLEVLHRTGRKIPFVSLSLERNDLTSCGIIEDHFRMGELAAEAASIALAARLEGSQTPAFISSVIGTWNPGDLKPVDLEARSC